MQKKCTRCKQMVSTDRFPVGQKKRGPRADSWCDECYGAYQDAVKAKQNATEKECGRCHQIKPRDAFNFEARHGLQSWCKQCRYEDLKKKMQITELREAYNARMREYNKREHVREKIDEYRKRPDRKRKEAIRQAVGHAARTGKLKKPDTCQLVGQLGIECNGRIEGDHFRGYEDEHKYTVIWLCVRHHNHLDSLSDNEHQEIGEQIYEAREVVTA